MYMLGKRSLQELKGVHPDLVKVVEHALSISEVDFGVHDGIRTVEEQRAYVESGVSRTIKSRHVEGCAVDLVPYINGKLRWEWEPIFKIALAVRRASVAEETPIRWGAIWDSSRMNELPGTVSGMKEAVQAYGIRMFEKGRQAFLDGPHFELPRQFYPESYIP